MTIRIALLTSLLALSACKGKTKLETKPIADSGFVIDLPSDWSVKSDMKDFYTVGSGEHGTSIQVIVHDGDSMPSSLDELATSCAKPDKATKESLPGGVMFMSCEAKVAEIKGKPVMATKISALAPGDKKIAECSLATDKDVDLVESVCKSLRKK
jgi:hypothetical protein